MKKILKIGLAIVFIAAQTSAIVSVRPLPAFAIGEGQQGGYQDIPNAAGQGGSGVDPTKISWLQMSGCLFAGAGAALSTFIVPPVGVAATGLVLSNADCQKVIVDSVKQVWETTTNLFQSPIDTIFKIIIEFLGSVVSLLSTVIVSIIVFFADPQVFKFATNPFVHAGWYVCLQIANMLIVLGLIILANQFILGIEKFGNYQALMNYIIAALFLNFSLTLASMAIGVSNFLTLTFLNLTGAPTSANPQWDIPRNFGDRLSEVFQSIANMRDVTGGMAEIIAAFSSLILGLVVLILLAAIAFAFIKRVIFLWSYLIIMPLAYVIGNIGTIRSSIGRFGGKDAWQDWMHGFMKELTFAPVMAFFLWLTLFALSGPMLSTAFNQQSATLAETWQGVQNFIMPLIFIGLLGFGFVTANKAADGSFGWAQTGVDWATKSVPAWVGRKTVAEPATKIGSQWLQSKPVQGLKAWGAEHSNIPIAGAVFGRMSQGINTLEERNKKPMQNMVDSYMKTHGFSNITDTSILLKRLQAAQAANDYVQQGAIVKRMNEIDKGYKPFAQAEAAKINLDKLEKAVTAAGGEFSTDEVYKVNPMLMPHGASASQTERDAFQKTLDDLKGDDVKNLGKGDRDGLLGKELVSGLNSADKFTAFMQAYKGHKSMETGKTMYTEFQTKASSGDLDPAIGELSLTQAKQMLGDKKITNDVKKILLRRMKNTLGTEDREKLTNTPNVGGAIDALLATDAAPTGQTARDWFKS